jgi:hypothetical protein
MLSGSGANAVSISQYMQRAIAPLLLSGTRLCCVYPVNKRNKQYRSSATVTARRKAYDIYNHQVIV